MDRYLSRIEQPLRALRSAEASRLPFPASQNAAGVGLNACLEEVAEGDTVQVRRVDRLGRSLSPVVKPVEGLREKDVYLRSPCDGVIDTSPPSGELIFNVFFLVAPV
ncbi:MAG: recombinase family protein [Syntrophobacteraceae bacterium]|jgi:DNA invertase Pin-like site-specific DNA recombinase|nr:recombinase family protein [Syntrophobacteraceae bacterium]